MAKKETLGAYLNRNIEEKGSTLSKEKAKGKKYKSISAAKKAGSLYYTNKAGKIMAAVYGEDLKVRLKGDDAAITYKGGKDAQKKGANTPNLRDAKGIQSRKLSPATVGKGRGDGEKELVQRRDDKRKAKLTGSDAAITYKGGPEAQKKGANTPNKRGPKPQPPVKLKDDMKEEVQANKGGMMKKKKTGYAAGGMPMVMKGGVKVPAFAADGKGKMNMGGMAVAKKKPAAKKMMAGGMATKKKPAAKKMMAGGMTKKSGYMYGGMAKKKMKK